MLYIYYLFLEPDFKEEFIVFLKLPILMRKNEIRINISFSAAQSPRLLATEPRNCKRELVFAKTERSEGSGNRGHCQGLKSP